MQTKMPRHTPRSQQKGFAAMLIVMLAGLGLIAATLGAVYSVRGVQDANLALQQTTQTQARAWQALEMVRMALASMPAARLDVLSGNLTMVGLANVSAKVTENDPVTGGRRVTVQVTATSAGASSTVEGVYEVIYAANTEPTTPFLPPTISINGSVSLSGSVNVISRAGETADFVVNGSVSLSGTVLGINKICATEDITLSSDVRVQEVCTDANLTMLGGARATRADVIGNVNLTGGGVYLGALNANGNVLISGNSAEVGALSTKGDVSVTGSNALVAGALESEGSVNWTSFSPASTIRANGNVLYKGVNSNTSINARGTTTLDGGGDVQALNSLGDIFLKGTYEHGVHGVLSGGGNLTYFGGQTVASGTIAGTLSGPAVQSWQPVMNVTQRPNFIPNIPVVAVPVIQRIGVVRPTVDVRTLSQNANYIFQIEGTSTKRLITIKNVTGIANGTYYLGSYADNHKDYLCTSVDDVDKCVSPVTPYKTLCQGFDISRPCFTYDGSKWKIFGETMAPGVAMFYGDLEVSTGKYINTFLSTGNITTTGDLGVYSPNYAGHAGVCTDTRAIWGITTSDRLKGIYPSDLCADGRYTPTTLANVALIAGGYVNRLYVNGQYEGGEYVGGDITLGNLSKIYGSVLAGNTLKTTGDTTVAGVIQSAGLQNGSGSAPSWGNLTTIDLTNFNQMALPCMGSGCAGGGSGSGGGTGTGTGSNSGLSVVKIFWSRYL